MIDESKIIVKDNYLSNDDYEPIKRYFMGNQCYWYYCGNYGGGYPQMEHTFHSELVGTQRYPNTPMVATQGMEVMSPLLRSFDYSALIRIRAICNWKTDPSIMTQRDWHVDVPLIVPLQYTIYMIVMHSHYSKMVTMNHLSVKLKQIDWLSSHHSMNMLYHQ